jgi:hypothetical protein
LNEVLSVEARRLSDAAGRQRRRRLPRFSRDDAAGGRGLLPSCNAQSAARVRCRMDSRQPGHARAPSPPARTYQGCAPIRAELAPPLAPRHADRWIGGTDARSSGFVPGRRQRSRTGRLSTHAWRPLPDRTGTSPSACPVHGTGNTCQRGSAGCRD